MSDPTTLGFDELFGKVGVLGLEFSGKLAALDGQVVRMRGFLAPAGHGEGGVLVLTRTPVAPCSDCGGGHDLPNDAVFVFPAEDADFAPGRMAEVEGVVEHGPLSLPEAEANSLVRLRDARWRDAGA